MSKGQRHRDVPPVYKQLLSEGIPTLEVQTVAFWINSLCWRYKQLLSIAIPMLEVQTVAF